MVGQARAQLLQQQIAAALVKLAHQTQVRRIVALFDKGGGHRLRQQRAVSIHHAAQTQQRFDKGIRRYHPRQPQRGKQRFRKGAEINHPTVGPKPLHGGHRLRVVPEFAVVIILHDPALPLLRQRQPRQPPFQAERRAGGILVRRGQVNKPRRAVGRRHRSLLVDRHAGNARAGVEKSVMRARIAGVFHPHFFAIIQQQQRQHLQRLLRTGQHNNLLRCAAHAARLRQISGERLTQRQPALRIAVAHQHAALPLLPGGKATPQLMRKSA